MEKVVNYIEPKMTMVVTFRKVLLFCLCFIPISLFAQQEILKKKIVIPQNSYSSIELIQYIQKSTNIEFSYKTKLLQDLDLKYKVTTGTLYEILNQMTEGKDLDFVVINGVVVIKSKKEIQKIIKKTKSSNPQAIIEYIPSQKQEPKEVTKSVSQSVISGKIVNVVSGESVIGATIFIDSLGIQITSNEFGFFSCQLPDGKHTVRVMHDDNFQTESVITVNSNFNQVIEFKMIDKKHELQSQSNTVLDSKILEKNTLQLPIKFFNVPIQKDVYALNDPIRDLEKIPGIQQVGDLSSYLSVRGGTSDQNMVLFDDAPIFNPTHLFGFYSTFIQYSIKDIKVYKADMPAQFGGKLSSVVDIRSRDGNENKLGFFTELGPVASTFCIETPIIKERASVIFNYRKSNLGWLLKDADGNALYGFHDSNFKLNFHTAKRHHFYYSFYHGGDVYNETGISNGEFGVKWNNAAHSLRWNYIISPKFFSNVTLYASEYNYYLYMQDKNIQYWNSKIATGGLKQDFTLYNSNTSVYRFGYDVSGYNFNPGNLQYKTQTNIGWNPQVSTGTIGILALYYSHEKNIGAKSKLIYGFRLPFSRNSGPSTEYVFNNNYEVVDTINYLSGQTYNPLMKFEPRIQYSYQITPFILSRVLFAQTTQFIHGISNSETQITSLDVWLPSSSNIKPQIARQYSMGLQYTTNSSKTIFSTDAYVKSMKNQLYYEDHANMLLNPLIEGEIRNGKVLAYGLECLLQQKGDKLSGWVSYTYSHTQMKIGNKIIPTIADRPHDISIGLTWKANKKIILETQWKYLSGKPITTPTGYYEYQGAMVPIYTEILQDRLPAYHKLDINAQFHLYKNESSKFKQIVTVSVYNVYARKNPFNVTYNKTIEDSKYVVPKNVYDDSQYISTMIYSGTLIPMITYAILFN